MGIREFLFFTDGASFHCEAARFSARRITLQLAFIGSGMLLWQSEEIKIELENENRLARWRKEKDVFLEDFRFCRGRDDIEI